MSAHQMSRKNFLSADLLEHSISNYNSRSVKLTTLKINCINESHQGVQRRNNPHYYKKSIQGRKIMVTKIRMTKT